MIMARDIVGDFFDSLIDEEIERKIISLLSKDLRFEDVLSELIRYIEEGGD